MICWNCGTQLQDDDIICSNCGQTQDVQTIKCDKCGMFTNKNFGVCPFCGNVFDDVAEDNINTDKDLLEGRTESIPDDVSVNYNKDTDCKTEKKDLGSNQKNKRRKRVALILIVAILAPILCAINFGLYNLISNWSSSKALEYSKKEIADIYDELDYSIISATIDYYCDEVKNTYLYDADGDGRKELFAVTYNDLYPQKPNVLAFDTIDVGTMASATQNGAAGSTCITTYNGNLALQWGYYSVGTMSDHYEEWTDSGWKTLEVIGDDSYDLSGIDEEKRKKIKEIEQKVNEAEQDFIKTINEMSEPVDIGEISHYQLLSNYYNAKNSKDIISGYKSHLDQWIGNSYKYIEDDIDGDGNIEYAFIINDFLKKWTNNLSTTGTDGFVIEDYISTLDQIGNVCIYIDANTDGSVFHTFFINNSFLNFDNVNISWQDGELLVNIVTDSKDGFFHFFCSEVQLSSDEYYNSDSKNFKTISERYLRFLEKNQYGEISAKYADVCDAPGEEIISVCVNNNASLLNVYSVYSGRIIKLYEVGSNNPLAVYITKKDGKTYLLNYLQNTLVIGGAKQKNTYRYWFSRFNKNYILINEADNYLSLDSDNSPTETDNAYFKELNSYIDGATVCMDPYELTGYSVMSGAEADYLQNDKYLYISNCNLNKKGTVHVGEDSWLNFRKGPSVEYDKILLNSLDSNSFVKQMNGSSVTVIDTVNTGDTENPIWVKIQIKYTDKTLTGYSSQRYIDIADIKSITVGEKTNISAKTNDGTISWQSNDSSILSIDESTGKATGLKAGLVLVSAYSESGLMDSCLIMVTND